MTTQLFKNTLHGIAELSPGITLEFFKLNLLHVLLLFDVQPATVSTQNIFLYVYNLAVWMMLVVTACGKVCVNVTHTKLARGEKCCWGFHGGKVAQHYGIISVQTKKDRIAPIHNIRNIFFLTLNFQDWVLMHRGNVSY